MRRYTTWKSDHIWFQHHQLMHIFNQCDGKGSRETVDLARPQDWKGEPLKPEEAVHFAMMRLTNILHRKTLCVDNDHWIVISPDVCERDPAVWPKYVFSNYDQSRKEWVKKPWRGFIRNEVSPGVYKIGCLNCKWHMYVDERFPPGKILMGMGGRTVKYFQPHPTLIGEDCLPLHVVMEGPAKTDHYAVITLTNMMTFKQWCK